MRARARVRTSAAALLCTAGQCACRRVCAGRAAASHSLIRTALLPPVEEKRSVGAGAHIHWWRPMHILSGSNATNTRTPHDTVPSIPRMMIQLAGRLLWLHVYVRAA